MKLTLHDNPFPCDCSIKHLYNFIQLNYERWPDLKNVTCDEKIFLYEVDLKDFCALNYVWFVAKWLFILLGFIALFIVLYTIYYIYVRRINPDSELPVLFSSLTRGNQ